MKILIVDDHVYNRDLLRFVLEDEGHECVEADNGLNAITVFDQDPEIALLLMDINMPVMDGIEAARRICAIKNDRAATIIFVTALDNADILVRCLDAGGDDFVPKPINEKVLLSKVNAHARNKDTYNRLREAHQELKYHQQQITREHAIVERVFANSLDRIQTRCQNLTMFTSPMSMFNGDVVLAAPSPSGGEYVLIGDFTGHGLSAAIGSLPVMSIFYDLVRRQSSVSEIVVEINRQLNGLLPSGMFFCASVLHLDRSGTCAHFWSGGMNDAILIEPGNTHCLIPGDHMPLGILTEMEFDERMQVHEFKVGSALYIYTDGVNEAKNSAAEEYGEARIIEVLRSTSAERVTALVDDLKIYQGGSIQNDDVSIVEIRCVPCVHTDKTTGEVVDIAAEYHSAKCFPWQLSMKLEVNDLRNTNIVNQTVAFLAAIEGVALHKDKLFTIASELFCNALEHGVLRLDSKLKQTPSGFEQYYQLRQQRLAEITDEFIKIDIAYLREEINRIRIQVTDSGDGFDYQARYKALEQNDEAYGRGLSLLNMLCSRLDYSDGGRTVTAYYDFC
jgi:two-component system, HptB-dependent secretion and biofilm response regulator